MLETLVEVKRFVRSFDRGGDRLRGGLRTHATGYADPVGWWWEVRSSGSGIPGESVPRLDCGGRSRGGRGVEGRGHCARLRTPAVEARFPTSSLVAYLPAAAVGTTPRT